MNVSHARILVALGVSLVVGCATSTVALRGTIHAPAADKRGIRDAVVHVVPANGRQSVARPVTKARMIHGRGGFEPHVLPVVRGTAVSFENHDEVFHIAFSVSPARRFDLTLVPGAGKTVTFAREGVVNVYCALHPKAAAYVLVLPNPVYARPDASGAFALVLSPGEYLVKVWHPTLGQRSRKVEVPSKGNSVRLEF